MPGRLTSIFAWNRGLLVLALATAAVAVISLLGLLYIQAIMLVWAICMFYLIIRNERKVEQLASYAESLPSSEWSAARKELDEIERRIENSKSADEAKILLARKTELERRLRNATWQMREDEMSRFHNIMRGRGSLRTENRFANPADRKAEGMMRKRLKKIVRDCIDISVSERDDAMKFVLEGVMNELRTLYRSAKSKDMNELASDIWFVWVVLESARQGVNCNSSMLCYVSERFRKDAESLLNAFLPV